MKSFKLKDGDICFNDDNSIVMTNGTEETAQALERCFTTNAGEWFLNKVHGLEYENIRGKGVTDEMIQIAVLQAAVQEERVKEVTGIYIERDKPRRTVSVKLDCLLVSGEAESVSFTL